MCLHDSLILQCFYTWRRTFFLNLFFIFDQLALLVQYKYTYIIQLLSMSNR